MSNILVITGSARPNSVNRSIVNEVITQLKKRYDTDVTVADLLDLALPFFNSPIVPSSTDHSSTPEGVKRWSELVLASDGVIFVAPEYNHSLSAIQKNAIDWLYKEWRNKPAAFIGYGAYAGKHSYEAFQVVNGVVKMSLVDTMAAIKLGDVVSYDGEVIDPVKLESILAITLDELVAAIK